MFSNIKQFVCVQDMMQKLVRRMTRFFVSVDPLSALDRLEQAVTDLGLSYRANAPSIVSQTLSHTTAILFHTFCLQFFWITKFY